MKSIAVYRRLAAKSATFATLLTGAVWAVSTADYVAEATLKPVGSRGSLSSLASVASQLGVGLGVTGEEQSLEYFINLITSREVLTQVLELEVELVGDTARVPLDRLLGAKGDTPNEYLLDAIERLRRRISASPDIRAGLIRVRVEMPSAAAAESVAVSVLSQADSLSAEIRRAQARDEREFLAERLQEANARLLQLERDLEDFRTKNRSVDASPSLQVEYERRQRRVDIAAQLGGAIERELQSAGAEVARNTASWALIERPERSARRDARPYALIWLALFLLTGVGVFTVSRLRAPGIGTRTDG